MHTEEKKVNIAFKDILEDWHRAFPFLSTYSPSRLYQRVGPFLIGLYIERSLIDYYELFLSIKPLWITDPKVFGRAEYNYYVGIMSSFIGHVRCLDALVKAVKNQHEDILTPKIEFNNFIKIFAYDFKRRIKCGTSTSPYFYDSMTELLEYELVIATYYGDEEWKEAVWKKIDKFIVKKFGLETSPSWGKTVGQWLNQMQAISDRVELMRRVEYNCRRPRVAKLQVGEFVDIEDFLPKKWTMKDEILTFLYELRGKWIKLERLLHI